MADDPVSCDLQRVSCEPFAKGAKQYQFGPHSSRFLLPEDDAEDAVQESLLRALRYFRTFAGGHGRAWFLKIVRNTCWGWRVQRASDQFDEEQHSGRRSALDPETLLLQADAALLVERAMSSLPDRARDVLAFRELEGMSYRELSGTAQVRSVGVVTGQMAAVRL